MITFEDVKEGPTRFYIDRTHDNYGRKLTEPKRELAVCKDCKNEKNVVCCPLYIAIGEDRNIEKDYCSRMELKK